MSAHYCSHVRRTCAMTFVTLLCGLTLSSTAFAQPTGYIGASFGNADSEVDRAGIRSISGPASIITATESDDAVRLFGGAMFNRYFGLEIGYTDLGTTTASAINFLTVDRYNFDITGFELSARGVVPIGEALEFYGRLGVYAWNSDFSVMRPSVSVNDSVSGADLLYAVGVGFNIGRHFSVRAEYAGYDVDVEKAGAGDFEVVTGSVLFRF